MNATVKSTSDTTTVYKESAAMMKIKISSFTVILLLFAFYSGDQAFAQSLPNKIHFLQNSNYKESQCDDKETIIYYSNGVATDVNKARKGSAKLAKELKSYLASNGLSNSFGKHVVANAYTETLGGIADGFFLDTLLRVLPAHAYLSRAQVYRWLQDRASAPDWFKKVANEREETINRRALQNNASAGNHAVGYDTFLNLGRSNIVVGHSYGTILANLAYFGINESNRPGHAIVMAALVDDKISGANRFEPGAGTFTYRTPYTTIEEDNILLVADIFLDALDANVDNWPGPTSPSGFSGHGFVSDYLADAPGPGNGQPNARDRIMEDIVAMKKFVEPRPCHGHLVSGGATTTDPITTYTKDKQVAIDSSGAHSTHDFATVPKLSSSGLQEKMIDWRGQYDQGEATRVLTYRGPAARYNGPTTYAGEIYRWGKLAYRTPQAVLGAAIQKDALGNEYVIAATHGASAVSGSYTISNTVVIWRRDAELVDLNSQPFDATSNPTGWQRVEAFQLPDGLQVSPWFFNGSGTKAGAMRRQTVSRYYGSDRRKDPICEQYPAIGGYCNPGEFSDEFPAGNYDVSELRRYTLEIPLPGSGLSSSVNFEQHEWGDKAILAVDYDDHNELLLREENNSPRGFLQNPDPDSPGDFRWLTLNGTPVFDQSSLNCFSASGVCRTQRSQGTSRNMGGFFAVLGDIEGDSQTRNTYHVFYSDLRTETFAYSIKDGAGGETEYWVVHNGKTTFLGKEMTGSQSVASYVSARYGYEGDYRNIGPEDVYTDYTTLVTMDAEKINPILGRYEVNQVNNIQISNPPIAFGFDVAVDKSLLATGMLSGGTTFNNHSVIGNLDSHFPNTNLSGQTLLPISVR